MKDVSVGILHKNGLVLACQRKKNALYPLQWEFPGGKIETGETPTDALIRELHEELGIVAVPGEEFYRQEWNYGDASYRVYYYSVRTFSGKPANLAFETIRWVTPRELRGMEILEGNREVVDKLYSDWIASPEEGSQ
jgi:8-oxo-dGTP diphosphatase